MPVPIVQWPSFFQLPVLMLMLITLLNDGTLISIGYDNVIPNPRPDKWNLRVGPISRQGSTCTAETSSATVCCHRCSALWSHDKLW